MLKNAMSLLWSVSSAGIKWILTLCGTPYKYTLYIFHFISFRFFPFIIMELAWQQMNANEQNDFRIVSVNLNY